jgi:hypothetical protein
MSDIKYLNIPERPKNSMSGSEFADHITGMSLVNREKALVDEILSGNVPSFSRTLKSININRTINSDNYEVTLFTLCDYMAIGSDEDYFYIPMTPSTAQYLADALKCNLPTRKLVDNIYNTAEIKLDPQPIPPSNKMTTVPVFLNHTDSIKKQFIHKGINRSGTQIVGGHKKDLIISNKIYSSDRNYERVVIYGWHLGINNPIQPVYNGHSADYADYSHGIRFISDTVIINGMQNQYRVILKDAALYSLLSSEGRISKPYYPDSDIFTSVEENNENFENGFKLNQNYPNPFNPTTTISYNLSKNTDVDLTIYNLMGEKINTLVSGRQVKGNYNIEWDAGSNASGIYICKLNTGVNQQSRKMILLR